MRFFTESLESVMNERWESNPKPSLFKTDPVAEFNDSALGSLAV